MEGKRFLCGLSALGALGAGGSGNQVKRCKQRPLVLSLCLPV